MAPVFESPWSPAGCVPLLSGPPLAMVRVPCREPGYQQGGVRVQRGGRRSYITDCFFKCKYVLNVHVL